MDNNIIQLFTLGKRRGKNWFTAVVRDFTILEGAARQQLRNFAEEFSHRFGSEMPHSLEWKGKCVSLLPPLFFPLLKSIPAWKINKNYEKMSPALFSDIPDMVLMHFSLDLPVPLGNRNDKCFSHFNFRYHYTPECHRAVRISIFLIRARHDGRDCWIVVVLQRL